MKVTVNDDELLVSWKYGEEMVTRTQSVRIGKDPSDLEGKRNLWEKQTTELGITTTCMCTIRKGEEILAQATVKKWWLDPEKRDKARKFVLEKALFELYPGKDHKEIRDGIWKKYHSRKKPKNKVESEQTTADV